MGLMFCDGVQEVVSGETEGGNCSYGIDGSFICADKIFIHSHICSVLGNLFAC